ncbi:MAG: 3'-5' exonuclease [Rhodospirillales bacterium]
MPADTLFVFDIETVPDTDAVPALTGETDPDPVKRRAALEAYHLEVTQGKNPFPRQPFHRVTAIAFLEAEIAREDGGEAYYLRELRAGGQAGYSEKQLVQGFFQHFERLRPRLVSFNGRGFDLPVLKYRAMVHGVSAPVLHDTSNKWDNYSVRYAPHWHCDLMDVLSDYGASARVRMNEICAVFGLPGKTGVDGADVAGLIDAGEINAVRDYCETDVLNTYLIYLRHRLHAGGVSKAAYNRSVADVITLIEQEGAERPHLAKFMEAWHEACGGAFIFED